MKLLLLAVTVAVVVCVRGDINQMCLTCCGAPPCCNYCGMNPDLFKPLNAVRRDVTNPLLGGLVKFCPECCGPPPCCSTCGMDFSKLKDFLATVPPVL